jgi:predicted dehydrogenase
MSLAAGSLMYTIKIIGAGSIGNHLANASRALGWNVILTDTDPQALERARHKIYPSRYGAWDEAIELKSSKDALTNHADVVFIGTPPDTHISIANEILDSSKPRALIIEKPVCGPDLVGCAALWDRLASTGVFAGVGYNHTLGLNTVATEKLLTSGKLGPVVTISARVREHWGGILSAHPWLAGPADSYLGFSQRGGGAAGEHSHAINMWQHFAHFLGAGRVSDVSATLDIVGEKGALYDRACFIALRTTGGLVGDVIQDVVTSPPEKSVRIQGRDGYVDWRVNHEPGADAVIFGSSSNNETVLLKKTRADDFKAEVQHIQNILDGDLVDSPIALERGLDTMMIIAAAFKSNATGRRVTIDWAAGYRPEALQ